jgi:hypothetical protein
MRQLIVLAAILFALSCAGCKGTDVDAGSYGLDGTNRGPSINSSGDIDGGGGIDVGVDGSGDVDLDVDTDVDTDIDVPGEN